MASVYETLIAFTPELELKPGLAETWETPDDTTIILNLREGVTFHFMMVHRLMRKQLNLTSIG
ncbi:hypothetical protein [Oceanobacillus rekensis]|uniref:hypothetical protein n=1 Tax=Oceanobacillus rekensis TaxID=937927 RepID=UPI00111D1232|nr:hypothetical protein [Oceanobacillus rekensis]